MLIFLWQNRDRPAPILLSGSVRAPDFDFAPAHHMLVSLLTLEAFSHHMLVPQAAA